ncbi:MAG TPA: zinc-binding dehydrogenase [Candidatus Dormibacteraeota bacterium]
MRALVADPTAPERISIQEVPEPEPGRDEVLVEVHAISLNRGELNRLAGAAPGWRPGWDIAGTTPDGRRVVGVLDGGAWAERVAVPLNRLAELPERVSFSQAAALPVAALTALRILRYAPDLLGRRVLIDGAAGGVGRFAIQLAHMGGAEVTASAGRPERAEGLDALGADRMVVGLGGLQPPYDLVLDSVGGDTLAALFKVVQPYGTLVMFGNSSNQPTTFDVRDVYLGGLIRLQGFTLFSSFPADPPARDLAYLVGLVAAGSLDPQVAGELRWEDMPAALARLRERSVPGKLVLKLR